ncbi:MAG TPA: SMC-Scp complex subunit ScpB [Gaiellaceae bacterium]
MLEHDVVPAGRADAAAGRADPPVPGAPAPPPVAVLEAVLFASDAPVEAERIREVLELPSADEARALVAELARGYDESGRALQIVEAGGGYRLVTRPDVAPWLVRLARSRSRSRLSRPALETLAIIAYRQPVSRPEVDAVRGVNSEGVLENLMERRMVRIAGRKDAPGRPFLYETTREFLVAFGLRDLGDLPRVDGELVLPDPEVVRGAAEGEPSQTNPNDPAGNSGTPYAAGGPDAAGEPSEKNREDPGGTSGTRYAAGDADATEQDPGASGADQPAGR